MTFKLRCTSRWTAQSWEGVTWRWHRQLGPTCGFVLIHSLVDQWCRMQRGVDRSDAEVEALVETVSMALWRQAWYDGSTTFGEIASNAMMAQLINTAWRLTLAELGCDAEASQLNPATVHPIDEARAAELLSPSLGANYVIAVGFDRDVHGESKIVDNGGESAHWGLLVGSERAKLWYLHGQSLDLATCRPDILFRSNAQCGCTTLADEHTFSEKKLQWDLAGSWVVTSMEAARHYFAVA